MLPSRTIPSQIRTTTHNAADDVSYITFNQYLQTLGIARAKIPTSTIQDATHEATYSVHVLWRDRNGKGKCSKTKCEDDSLVHRSGLCRMRKKVQSLGDKEKVATIVGLFIPKSREGMGRHDFATQPFRLTSSR